jgi:hypothetical protein
MGSATGHLPPPPQRDASGRLPLPRSQTGRLPFPGGGSTESEPMTREPLIAPPATSEPEEIPVAPHFAPAAPPAFTPPASLIAAASASAEKSVGRPTMPLPDYQPLFGYNAPEDEPGAADVDPSPVSPPMFDPVTTGESADPLEDESGGELTVEELKAQTQMLRQERDQAQAELEVTRSSGLGGSDDKLAEDLAKAISERDEARMEVIVLRSRNEAAEQTRRDTDAMASQLEELSHVIDERDSVRRDYASLREQFETLKLDRSQLDSNEANQALQDEIQMLRDQLAAGAPAGESGGGADAAGNSAELAALKEQVKLAREETSLAHRGLALSQKALQETREALREATEGTSSSKGNLEEMKKERATLVRQNMLLQGQNEQLQRDLSAAKAKLGAKGV